MRDLQEEKWVADARRGDTAAFESLLRRYEKRVLALTGRMCRNPEDAQEAAQEAFLAAWQGLSSFRGDSSFSTWLYRLTTNLCIDWLRRQKRRQETAPAVSLDDEEAPLPEPADPRGSPEEELERRELRRAVERGLQALPDHHRQVLVMRELSGMSYQEIGAVLDLDLGTVKSRIARARLALKKFLVQEGNFSPETPSKQTKSRRGG